MVAVVRCAGGIGTALAVACFALMAPTWAAATTATATATSRTPATPPTPTATPAFRQVTGSPFAAGPGATSVAFSPNGEQLAVADDSINAASIRLRILSDRVSIRTARVELRVACAGNVDGRPGHLCHGRLTLSRDGHRLG
jgi:glucose/arabinose dehydrogenase